MTENEYLRMNETPNQSVNRKKRIINKLEQDVMMNPNYGVKKEYGKVDSTVFQYISKSSKLNTERKTYIQNDIRYAKWGKHTIFFTDIVQDDIDMILLLYELGAEELEVLYKEIILDDDSSILIKSYKKDQDATISRINEYSNNIKQLIGTLGKPKRGTRMSIYIDNRHMIPVIQRKLEVKLKELELSDDIRENITIIDDKDNMYKEMKYLVMTLEELDRNFGSEQRLIYEYKSLMCENVNKEDQDSTYARVDAIIMLKSYCSRELQYEINLMQWKNPHITLKEVYEMVTELKYDKSALWAEWKAEIEEIKNQFMSYAQVLRMSTRSTPLWPKQLVN